MGRDDMERGFAEKADLVIALGGDGTTLAVARYLEKTPLLSLKLNDDSIGYLCSGEAALAAGRVSRPRNAPHFVLFRFFLEVDGFLITHGVGTVAVIACRNDLSGNGDGDLVGGLAAQVKADGSIDLHERFACGGAAFENVSKDAAQFFCAPDEPCALDCSHSHE
jgi:hypothetical protein